MQGWAQNAVQNSLKTNQPLELVFV